jgi:peptide/nickel transport system permease protein
MRSYVVRRLLLIVPTLILASFIVFLTIRLIPGSIVTVMVEERSFSGGYSQVGGKDAMKALVEKELGLDVPIQVQYLRWAEKIILHGDLGNSLWKDTKVTDEIANRIPVTIELAIMAIAVATIISFPIGVLSAVRQDSVADYIGRTVAILCIAVPSFWLGTMIMVFPAIWWGWSPPIKYIPFVENPIGNLEMFAIPGAVLGLTFSGINMRLLRTTMLDVLRQDYIRTAWAKGLKERVIITRHVARNALIPVLTVWGLQLPGLIGIAVIVEQIFSLPGLGRLMVDSAFSRDYPIISGLMLTTAVLVLFLNVFIDIAYSFLDPRIRFR